MLIPDKPIYIVAMKSNYSRFLYIYRRIVLASWMQGMNPGPGGPGWPREAIVAFGGGIRCEDIGPGNYSHTNERLGSQ